MIYFDHAAASVPDREMLRKFSEYPAEYFLNPEAAHPGGNGVRILLGEESARCGRLLFGAKEICDEFYFASSGSEVFNLLGCCSFGDGVNFVSTSIEHPALLANLARLNGEKRALKVNRQGEIDIDALTETIDEKSAVCALHQVHNELGTVQNLAKIVPMVRKINPNCLIIVDAVQAAGKIPIFTEGDFTVISGHKFGAAAGGGAGVINSKSQCVQILRDAVARRRNEYWSGRTDSANAVALLDALQKAERERSKNFDHVIEINRFLRQELSKIILPLNQRKILFTIEESKSSPFIMHLIIPGYQGGVLVRFLGQYGVWLSSGSACQSEAGGPNKNMLALGYKAPEAYATLRLSFSGTNTRSEAEEFIEIFKRVLKEY